MDHVTTRSVHNSTCSVCLDIRQELIDIFGEQGKQFRIAQIITKHLWFECDKSSTNLICMKCLTALKSFNEFYNEVEGAHNHLLSESDNFKVETLNIEISTLTEKLSPIRGDEKIGEILDIPESVNNENCIEEIKNNNLLNECTEKSIAESISWLNNENFDIKTANDVDICSDEEINKDESLKLESENDYSENGEVYENSLIKSESNDENESKTKVTSKKTSNNYNASRMETEDEQIRAVVKMKCELCDCGFNVFRDCKSHYRSDHDMEGYLFCCDTKYHKRVRLVEHIQRHIYPNGFACPVCNRTFLHQKGLKLHMEKHDNELERLFKCEKCPKTFLKNYQLRQHQLRHITEKNFACPQCDKNFVKNSILQYHIRGVHNKAYIHVCDICAKEFRSKSSYEQHCKVTHSEQKLQSVQCQICGTWLKHEISLRGHMRIHNQSENEYICNICGKKAPNRGALRSHMKYVHLNQSQFKCTVCEKIFKRELNLKEHMTIHTGDILYTCSFCPKTFNSSANMHAHRKKLHPVEWQESRMKNAP